MTEKPETYCEICEVPTVELAPMDAYGAVCACCRAEYEDDPTAEMLAELRERSKFPRHMVERLIGKRAHITYGGHCDGVHSVFGRHEGHDVEAGEMLVTVDLPAGGYTTICVDGFGLRAS